MDFEPFKAFINQYSSLCNHGTIKIRTLPRSLAACYDKNVRLKLPDIFQNNQEFYGNDI